MFDDIVKAKRTEFPTSEFRWEDGLLEQRVEVIQHYPDKDNDVGVWEEWRKVICNGEEIK